MEGLRIVYMGTPDFAVLPLKKLVESGCHVVGVVTNPDKPAGRGQQLQESAVKKYAREAGLKILQPEKFRNEDFLKEFKLDNFDVIIDAIDDIKAKVALAKAVNLQEQIFVSSMGGARRIDSSRIKIAPIFKTHTDAFARKVRYELKKANFKGSFDVVFSDESAKCVNLGSFMGVTASFGLALSSLVLQKVLSKA